MKDPAGNPAPSGGFQTGGWYSGYQYWNGTFAPQAGVIHPASTQQGAGQTVSPEVNAQTSVQAGLAPGANQAYVDAQNAKPVANPSVVTTPQTPSTGAGTTGVSGTAGIAMPETPTLDVQNLYKSLTESSGVKALQDDYLAKERQFIDAKAIINDNPWISEADRVGRAEKLTQQFNDRTANIQKEIAMRQADTEMQLNLATKQFDINSEVAKTNLDKLNMLLAGGFLDGASGEDIAGLTRSTGVSSEMIQSAIKANKKTEDVKTQVITSTADSGEVTVSVVNTQTGDIISQNSLGRVGNQQGPVDGNTFTPTQNRDLVAKATIALDDADTNSDKGLSIDEYKQALQDLIKATGVDTNTADNTLTSQMNSLGYWKWNW